MKLSFLILLLFLLPNAHANGKPQITLLFKNGHGKEIYTTMPIEGRYFWARHSIDTLDENGQITYNNEEHAAGLWTFRIDKSFKLYVRPGKSYRIIVDNDSIQNIEGDDQEAQLLLNRFNPPSYQQAADKLYATLEDFKLIKEKLIYRSDSVINPFKTLYTNKKIDQGLYQTVRDLVKNYYASVLGFTLYTPMKKLVYHQDSSGYDKQKILLIDKQWKEVFAFCDPLDPAAMTSTSYLQYAEVYIDWYQFFFRYNIEGTYQEAAKPENYWKQKNDVIIKSSSGKVREHLLAYQIYFTAAQMKFESFLPELYDSFKTKYPASIYLAWLEPEINTVRNYHRKIKADFNPSQRFIDNYQSFTTFDELAALFKNKTVYVDIWATWCGPCKEEFTHNKELKTFLKKEQAEVVYISLDADNYDQRWKDMIKYYELDGFHIRGSKELQQNIHRSFGKKYGDEYGIAIPHYLIIKNGQVVERDAKRPSDKDTLYNQIKKYL
jgi:thiol-disulfide isomerase/thioredoxin